MELLTRLRSSIGDLKAGQPGRRFRDHHSRNRNAGRPKGLLFLIGWVLIALGALLSLVPGIPGIVLAIPGAALVSAESRSFARMLDWLEVRARRLLARMH